MPIDAKAPGMPEPQMSEKGMAAKTASVQNEGRTVEPDKDDRQIDRGIFMLPAPARSLGLRALQKTTKKICVLGDHAVGKTSLIRRFALDCFDDSYTTTVGARIIQKPLVLEYPERSLEVWLNLRIWEISGQSQHLELYPAYYRGAEGAIIVGDVARTETQLNLWKWIQSFRAVAGRVPVILLVNKTDIMDSDTFDHKILDDISGEFGCPYRMGSAKTGANVDNAFRELGERLVGKSLFSPWHRGMAR